MNDIREALGAAYERLTRSKDDARVPDATRRMFSEAGRQLTMWYTIVLAGVLLLAGILLYAGMRAAVLGPVNDTLASEVTTHGGVFSDAMAQGLSATDACRFAVAQERRDFLITCYDSSGTAQAANPQAQGAPGFMHSSLVTQALKSPSGTAEGVLDGGDIYVSHHISTLAVTIRNSVDHSVQGVVQVGFPVDGQLSALDTLRLLELIVGVFTLIGATVGGAFLSKRSLTPARQAFANQQRFIADASHELRTPLTLLRANAEVLQRDAETTPEASGWLDDIVSEVSHMERLTDHLLTLARLDSGKLKVDHALMNLGSVADRVVHRSRALAAERKIALTAETQPVTVVGDTALLEELALILVDNAIKYTADGGNVTVRVSREGDDALLAVHDTGIGISDEHITHIGERFYRVDKARSRETGGAGLGLSIAHGIAQAHGGTLTLSSQPGQGTAAVVRLHVAKEQTASAALHQESTAETPSAAG